MQGCVGCQTKIIAQNQGRKSKKALMVPLLKLSPLIDLGYKSSEHSNQY